MDPKLIINSKPLDFELCELLGEGSADFIVICANGEPVPFLGTPYDSPRQRETYRKVIAALNERPPSKTWRDLFLNWFPQFCAHYKLPIETTARDFHPEFSFAISRVCHGYSEHLHAAIGLFGKLGDRVNSWEVSKADDGTETVEIEVIGGAIYRESGRGLAGLISLAAVRVLRATPRDAGLVVDPDRPGEPPSF